MKGARSPRQRESRIRVSTERERRRLKRRDRHYDPLRVWSLTEAQDERPNPRFKLKGKVKGTQTIAIPARLECSTNEDWELLCRLLVEIRTAALEQRRKRIVLNFHEVTAMSPEAAVTIVAEIQRCKAFCKSRTDITGTYPASHDVAALLNEVGFFKALNIKPQVLPKSFQPRSYLQIERNHRSMAEVADRLLDCFSGVFSFDSTDRRRLHVALVECMDNVFEHAYAVGSKEPYLFREWWLAGYADETEGTIGFAFYDQGSGIPTTIRARKKRYLKERFARLAAWTDGHWIVRAFTRGVSRHASVRRGHGLVKLKNFVDKLGVSGSLKVVANRGIASVDSDNSINIGSLQEALHGTLVLWQINGVAVSVPEGGADANAS